MTQIVVMPGGFHPFHAGHMALYNSAREAFPDAEVYVAATNDTSSRPFPFAVKEKLAKLAGVDRDTLYKLNHHSEQKKSLPSLILVKIL